MTEEDWGQTDIPAVISTHNLRRIFRSVVALDSLSLRVESGTLFGIVGPDGAGKTTTLRLLSGILTPSAGGATVCGLDVPREAEKLKGQIGYMSQRFGLYPDLTVLENLLFYADIHGVSKKECPAQVDRLLGFSQLTAFKDRLAGNLSGGMKQKLGLACALIHTPRLLLLDEPTNGVDPVSRRDFWRILYQLGKDGVTIVVSTSYLDEAERCSRIALLDQGRLLAQGTPDEVKAGIAGAVWEIRLLSARKAAAVLRERLQGSADHVGVFGDRLHVIVRHPAGSEERLRTALSGFERAELRRVPPSLEDVFVAGLGNTGEGAQP